MNTCQCIGRWTKDIEFKATESGGIAKCSIAVDEGFGAKKYTSFFEVVMFGKTAEAVANNSAKGRKVAITGRLRQERWDKDGRQQSAVRIYANEVDFLDYKDNESKAPEIDPGDLPF